MSATKGRGTLVNITNRFDRRYCELADGSDRHLQDLDPAIVQQPEPVEGNPTEVRFEQARSIVSTNRSPDIPFDRSVNPYRGCEHGCIYCYARPTHGWIDLSPGLDFERIIVAKTNAAELLDHALGHPAWVCEPINIGSITDPYQPVERRLGLTRALLEVATRFSQPVTLITKSSLIERDIDLLSSLASRRLAAVMMTLTTLDAAIARTLEPRASAPWRRLETIKALARAGIPVSVSIGPVIPFINDQDIERILSQASAAGAVSAHYTVIRLPWEVAPLFERWLLDHYPDRANRVMNRIRDMRGGRRNDPSFHSRMKGEGVFANLIRQRVGLAAGREGLSLEPPVLDCTRFRTPASRFSPPPTRSQAHPSNGQLSLF